MKICILAPRFPLPENAGDVLRINNIARYLRRHGHYLILISFYETGVSDLASREIYDIYNKVYTVRRRRIVSLFNSLKYFVCGRPIQCGYYRSRSYAKLLHSVVEHERPDLYICHLLRMTPYLESLGLYRNSIIEMTDALSKSYSMSNKAQGLNIKKIIFKFEKTLIRKYEKHVLASFPKIVLVSSADVEYFKDIGFNTKSVSVYPNGVDSNVVISTSYDYKKICFVGNMRALPNQDAAIHFVKEIFPLILKKIPEAVFYIVGAQPSKSILNLQNNRNIFVTGFVENINDYVTNSCMLVAPVRIAAGIQNKVLVAMSDGIPVVMTSLIAKAIPGLKNGENCIINDQDESFGDSCVRLMQHAEFRNKIAEGGHVMVRDNYGWDTKLKGYEILRVIDN